MKSIVNRIVVLLAIFTFTSVLAFGKTTEKKVTFNEPVSVNGTLVKKGTYKVTFNDETGELTIKKGSKVVATAQARLEQTTDRYSFYTRAASNDPNIAPSLVSVFLRQGNVATLVNNSDKGVTVRQ